MGWKTELAGIGVIMGGLFVIVLVINFVLSLLGIWALNTLFATHIPFTVQTIFAAMILVFIVSGAKASFNKKE